MDAKPHRIWTGSRRGRAFLLLLEAVLVLIPVLLYLCERGNTQEDRFDLAMELWKSSGAVLEEDGTWYADEQVQESVIDSPRLTVPAGWYTLQVAYECTENQTFSVMEDWLDRDLVRANPFSLDRHTGFVTYRFQVTGSLKSLRLRAHFDGQGSLRIREVTLRRSALSWLQTALLAALLLLLADLLYWKRQWLREHRVTAAELVLCVLLASLPLLADGLNTGHDLQFHLNRIEGIAAGLRSGAFPVRLSGYWLGGYGYPTSVYYGELLLYLPAALRLLGVPVMTAYKIYVLFINALTTGIAWLCFRGIFRRESTAAAVTMAYCLSGYRLVNLYIRSACGEYSAMAFFPLVALAVHRMYTKGAAASAGRGTDPAEAAAESAPGSRQENAAALPENRGTVAGNAALLAIGMTGILQTHILSAEMTALVLLAVCVLCLKTTFRRPVLLTWVLGAVWAVFLNAWFLVPFLDYMQHVAVRINRLMNSVPTVGNPGAAILQYFAVFQSPYGISSLDVSQSLALTPGLLLMAGLLAAVFLVVRKRRGRAFHWHLGLSLLLLFMASDLFPWSAIGRSSGIGHTLTQVQYPWRYLALASVPLALLLGDVLEELRGELRETCEKNMAHALQGCLLTAVIGCGIFSAVVFAGQYADGMQYLKIYDQAELDSFGIMSAEYLPQTVNPDRVHELAAGIEAAGMDEVLVEEHSGTHWQLYCRACESGGHVILPAFDYKGYRITDAQGTRFSVENNGQARITFFLPPGYEGRVQVSFVPPFIWRTAELISLITLLCSVLWAARRRQVKVAFQG